MVGAISVLMGRGSWLQVVALIAQEVHARDTIDKLYQNGCRAPTDFDWISQLRFYWDRDDSHCLVKQVHAGLAKDRTHCFTQGLHSFVFDITNAYFTSRNYSGQLGELGVWGQYC
jgi:hypothetical protein